MLRRVYPGGVRHTNGGRFAEGGALREGSDLAAGLDDAGVAPHHGAHVHGVALLRVRGGVPPVGRQGLQADGAEACLLYTSDAADE